MNSHTCYAVGCQETVGAGMFMCAEHWAMVPELVQLLVLERYQPGAEKMSTDFKATLFVAISCVVLAENNLLTAENLLKEKKALPTLARTNTQRQIEEEQQTTLAGMTNARPAQPYGSD